MIEKMDEVKARSICQKIKKDGVGTTYTNLEMHEYDKACGFILGLEAERGKIPEWSNRDRCETCGAWCIDSCINCGAPQCCPQCCRISRLKGELKK